MASAPIESERQRLRERADMEARMSLLDMLVQQCIKDSQEWFPEAANAMATDPVQRVRALVHHSLSLCGEAGELANLIKKVDRGSYDITNVVFTEDASEELVDAFIYVLNLAGILGVDLLRGYLKKRDKNVKRFSKNGRTGDVA